MTSSSRAQQDSLQRRTTPAGRFKPLRRAHRLCDHADFLSFATKTFLTPKNLINVVRQVSVNGIIAVGMMLVLLTGGIDLSVGSVVALSGVVAASFAQSGTYPIIVPVAMGLLVGVLVGAVNGFLIVRVKIVPFIRHDGHAQHGAGVARWCIPTGARSQISPTASLYRQAAAC
jgi:ribose/xylose/arabinose/galactoside ABC-type transport system permease subunit